MGSRVVMGVDLDSVSPLTAVKAVMWATYNVGSFHALAGEDHGEPSISQFLYEVSPKADRGYVEEKLAVWRDSQLQLIRSFDVDRFEAFVAWCVRHHLALSEAAT